MVNPGRLLIFSTNGQHRPAELRRMTTETVEALVVQRLGRMIELKRRMEAWPGRRDEHGDTILDDSSIYQVGEDQSLLGPLRGRRGGGGGGTNPRLKVGVLLRSERRVQA